MRTSLLTDPGPSNSSQGAVILSSLLAVCSRLQLYNSRIMRVTGSHKMLPCFVFLLPWRFASLKTQIDLCKTRKSYKKIVMIFTIPGVNCLLGARWREVNSVVLNGDYWRQAIIVDKLDQTNHRQVLMIVTLLRLLSLMTPSRPLGNKWSMWTLDIMRAILIILLFNLTKCS